jgi:hypothetical protein
VIVLKVYQWRREVHLLRPARFGSVGADREVGDGGVASSDRAGVSALPPAATSAWPGRTPAPCDGEALVRRPSGWPVPQRSASGLGRTAKWPAVSVHQGVILFPAVRRYLIYGLLL